MLSAGWTSVQADEKPSFAAQAQIAVEDQQSPRYIIKYKELAPSPMSQANQPHPLSAGRFESRAAQRLLSQAQVQPLMHLDSQAASVAHLSPAQLKQLQANPAIDYIELDPRRYLMAEQVPYGIPMVQALSLIHI